MNKETLNKIKYLADMAAHLPADVTLEDEDAALKALHGELAADTVLELIALAERTTSPVSQITDEQIDAVYCEMYEYDPGVVSAPECHLNFARRILAAAAPHAQAPAAPVANPVPSYAAQLSTGLNDPFSRQPQPVAEQGELPRYSPSVVDGVAGMMDNPAGSYVLWKDAQVAIAASQQAAGPVAWPSNEELQALWDESHAGHPVDFAADVLERWGGCPAGLLGNGSAPAIQQPQDERAAFEAWAKYCGLRLDMATHQFAWEGWKARATAAEAKLEAIRQGVEGLKRYHPSVGYPGRLFEDESGIAFKFDEVLALLQPEPKAGGLSYQDCGTGTQSVRQLAASMIQLNEPECELAFMVNSRRINIYVKILRVSEQESDESGLPG